MCDSVILPCFADPPTKHGQEEPTVHFRISHLGSTPLLTNTLFSAYRTNAQRRATLLTPLHTLQNERPANAVHNLLEQDANDSLRFKTIPLK